MTQFATGFCAAAVFLLITGLPARADLLPLTSYQFQGTLAADQAGKPALTSVNPLGTNGFQSAALYGLNRQVYRFNGDASPVANQGGLTLNTSGLLTPDNYSVEMVFSFDSDQNYRRILDTSGRTSDNGFYVNPDSHLDLYNITPHPGSRFVAAGMFHHLVLTNGHGTVRVYLDGGLDLTLATTAMNITSPSNLLAFFLDNQSGVATNEYSSGAIGLLRVYDGELDAAQVRQLAAQPFGAVPEPSSMVLLAAGLGLGLLVHTRRRALMIAG